MILLVLENRRAEFCRLKAYEENNRIFEAIMEVIIQRPEYSLQPISGYVDSTYLVLALLGRT